MRRRNSSYYCGRNVVLILGNETKASELLLYE